MLRTTFRLAAVFGLLSSYAAPSYSQDWTRFRGPNGTGINSSSNIPVQFSEGDYNWKITLPGVGHSSPVLWGKRLFITSAEEDKGKRHAICIDASNGKLLWQKTEDFTSYRHHELNNCASSTPTVDSERVYFLWATPDAVSVEAYDHAGSNLWKRNLGKLAIQHGIGTSPVIVGDVLLFGVYQEQDGPEGFLIGLNRKSGEILWKKPRSANQSASYATPLVLQNSGAPPEVVFSSTAHGITSVNPKTGDINWEVTDLFKLRCVASPVLANGLIFQTAGQGAGDRQAVAVRPGSKNGHTGPVVAYKLVRGPSYVPTPIAAGNRIYAWGDGGIVTCLKADTGEQVWQERVGGNFYGSPVCINGKLYCMSAKGELVVIEASDQFKIVAKTELGEQSHSTPAVADGVMYLRTVSHLISVGGKSAGNK